MRHNLSFRHVLHNTIYKFFIYWLFSGNAELEPRYIEMIITQAVIIISIETFTIVFYTKGYPFD